MSQTPAPWTVGASYSDEQWPTGVSEIVDGSGYAVALVPLHWGSARDAERGEFPHAIAASLDLLKALVTLRSLMWKEGYADQTAAMKQADEAIAKATGGAA